MPSAIEMLHHVALALQQAQDGGEFELNPQTMGFDNDREEWTSEERDLLLSVFAGAFGHSPDYLKGMLQGSMMDHRCRSRFDGDFLVMRDGRLFLGHDAARQAA